jgi:hypothetical protein
MDFGSRASLAVDQSQWTELSRMLTVGLDEFRTNQLDSFAKSWPNKKFGEFMTARLRFVAEQRRGRGGYEEALKMATEFEKVLEEASGRGLEPLLQRIVRDLVAAAQLSDAEADSDRARAVETTIKALLAQVLQDRARSPDSKRSMLLVVANQLLVLYHHLGNSALAQKLVTGVEGSGVILDSLPRSQYLSYCFHVGRMELARSNFSDARQRLRRFYDECPVRFEHNRRLALLLLIPLEVSEGRFPSPACLRTHRLDFLHPLLRAIQAGDFPSYRAHLRDLEDFLLSVGLIMAVERLWAVVLRNLVRRVFVIRDRMWRINVTSLAAALSSMGEGDGSVSMALCWLALLIKRGMIRGYISQQHATLVVSRDRPFPLPWKSH